jgi:nucleotide-binding universal stress UspA family protein
MQKILLVINAEKANTEAISFACKIAAMSGAKLTGLMIENIYFEYIPSGSLEALSYFATVQPVNSAVKADKDQTVQLFKNECKTKLVNCEVIDEFDDDPLKEVVFESRFADLLIIDPQVTVFEGEDKLPSHFVKEVLAKAECPVLLAPEKFNDVEEIDFCYDGSASSVFAMKQFTYLMRQFREKKVNVLEVKTGNKAEYDDADRKIMEWLRANYPSVCYHALKGDAKNELFTHLFMSQNKMIVMGAYGRSILSNFFKRSSADILIRTVDLPLFIAHQ